MLLCFSLSNVHLHVRLIKFHKRPFLIVCLFVSWHIYCARNFTTRRNQLHHFIEISTSDQITIINGLDGFLEWWNNYSNYNIFQCFFSTAILTSIQNWNLITGSVDKHNHTKQHINNVMIVWHLTKSDQTSRYITI